MKKLTLLAFMVLSALGCVQTQNSKVENLPKSEPHRAAPRIVTADMISAENVHQVLPQFIYELECDTGHGGGGAVPIPN